MKAILRCAFAAVAVLLCAQQAAAQPMTGCPPGQAMQASSPSGKQVTCISVPDAGAIANAVADVNARVDAITESSIVGKWAVTGTTTCLQSSNGFNAFFSPALPSTVSQLAGTFIGIRTFKSDGTGRSVGTTQSVTFPATFQTSTSSSVTTNAGGASVATLDVGFTWSMLPDGRLSIDDDNTIPQPFTAPPFRVGGSATIVNVPPFVGYISKDKKTILLTHEGMQIETSTVRNADGTTNAPNPRFCARSRVMTRLPD